MGSTFDTQREIRGFVAMVREEIMAAAAKHADGKRTYLLMLSRDLLLYWAGKSEFRLLYDVAMTSHVAKLLEQFPDPLTRSYVTSRIVEDVVFAASTETIEEQIFNKLLPTP